MTVLLKPEKWVQGGLTLAHTEAGAPIFVHGALPGEQVEARILREKAGHSFARVDRILEPSPDRIPSDCAAFPECGGCSFRHMSYEKELDLKISLLQEMRNLTPALPELEVFSAAPDGYRQVARLHRSGPSIGYYGIWSETIVPFPHSGCRHLPSSLNDAIAASAIIQPEKDNSRKQPAPGHAEAEKTELSFFLSKEGTVLTETDPPGPNGPVIEIEGGGLRWLYRPGMFLQANRFLLGPWLEWIKASATAYTPAGVSCLELFCGTGLIGGFLFPHLSRYQGIESSTAAVKQAQSNFDRSGLKGRFRVEDLYRHPERLGLEASDATLWVVNPPRAGLKEPLCRVAATSKADTILYSSCNPHTLDRDVALLRRGGFEVQRLALFDFFPRTPHVELVGLLKRVGNTGT